MAKRGAEALACRAPWESRLSHAPLPKRSRSDSERRELRCAAVWSGGSCKKRKRAEEEEGETEEGKRPAPSKKTSGPQKGAEAGTASLEGSVRLLPPEEEAASGNDLVGRWDASEEAEWARAEREVAVGQESGPLGSGCWLDASPSGTEADENDVWHYNSFQYWRSPLPTIDLSDILDLEKDDTIEAKDSSNIGLSEMET